MELIVTQENLNKALSAVSRVAGSKSQLPILNNILFRTDNTRLLIASTNLEIAITQVIGAKVAKQGAITVPARLVSEFISNLPKEPIELKVVNNNLHISSGENKSVINGVIADEFPELPTINKEVATEISISKEEFKESVSKTIIATSHDTTRIALTGVYLHTFNKNVYITATDGYRLAETKLNISVPEISAIIPTQSLQEVLRVIDDGNENIEIVFDDTQVRFNLGDTEIISRLIDGKFPDYRQLIPDKNTTSVKISKEEFSRITKLANLFSRESNLNSGITITANESKSNISIHSIASELGENTSVASAKTKGDGQITINAKYILEALSVINGDEINFEFSSKIAPTVIKSKDDPNYLHIIMPLKS